MLCLLLVLLSGSVASDRDPLYARVESLIERSYLDLDGLDVQQAVTLAAEAAEDAVPWLMVEREGAQLQLIHGEAGPFATVSLDVPGWVEGLDAVERAIRAGPGPLPEDVELPVELLRGFTRALDPYTTLLYEGRLQRFTERVQGTFAGVGARIGLDDGALTVREVFPDSPAARGGLRAGDRVVEIDGFSTAGLDVDQSVRRIRGPEGSEVVLTVERPGPEGEALRLDLTVTRGLIRIPNVTWRRVGGVMVIEIENFSKQTLDFVQQALADPGDLQGVVLDLRGNTGGSLQQACAVSDAFLDEGVIVGTAGRGGQPVRGLMERCEAAPGQLAAGLPLVVLVDGESASASEIVAGSLQRAGRALLVGTPTFGKGTVQKSYTVRAGPPEQRVELKLTEAEYLVGGDLRIEAGVGLTPDVEVARVAFNGAGAWLPEAGRAELVLVDERAGWREGVEPQDPLLDLALRLVGAASGPERAALRQTFEALAPALRAEQDARLVETFAAGGLDWSPGTAPPSAQRPTLRWETPGPWVSGGREALAVVVENPGEVDLHRVHVALATDDLRSPWGGRTLAVGRVPAGGSARGQIQVTLPPGARDRVDRVDPTLHAEGLPPLALPSRALEVRDPGRAPVRFSVSFVSGETSKFVLNVENTGEAPLGAVQAWLAIAEGVDVELLARDAALAGLAPGEARALEIPLRLPPGATRLEGVELRVEVEGRGEALRAPLSMGPGEPPVSLDPPRVALDLPLVAEAGPVTARVEVGDERGVAQVMVWWDGDQVAWRGPSGPSAAFTLPLVVEPGLHSLWVEAIDDQGLRVTAGRRVQGPPPGEAAAAREP